MKHTNKLYVKRNLMYKEWGENPTSEKYVEYLRYDKEFKDRITKYWPVVYAMYESNNENY